MINQTNKTYWSSGLIAVNPEHIAAFDGTIIRTIFREDKIRFPTLFVTIRRDADLLERTLGFCYSIPFMDGFESESDTNPQRGKMLEPIHEIYQGFEVLEPSHLVGKPVTALYYNLDYNTAEVKRGTVAPNLADHLIGIRRR
jgi:hypothetical protein